MRKGAVYRAAVGAPLVIICTNALDWASALERWTGEFAVQHADGGFAGNIHWTQHIQYRQDKQHHTAALAGLNDDNTCGGGRRIAGYVIKRDFASDEITVRSIVVENRDGTRYEIDVPQFEFLGVFPDSVLQDGLQRLTRPGRTVSGSIVFCGVDGSTAKLDSIS